jgi:acyl dehydratase/NAD(P)-dependent dehydrogenase (short-subunit alcohol dehydrogenase family)
MSANKYQPLATRCFTAEDQLLFAAASGDVNPMHMDPIAARRTISGRQVVHGVHTLMCAIDLWCESGRQVADELDCSFEQPISVGETIDFAVTTDADGGGAVTASVGGIACTTVRLGRAGSAVAPEWSDSVPRREVGWLASPLDEAPGSQLGQEICIPGRGDDWAQRFPHAVRALGTGGLQALAGLSYFVGMICPGLNSVFSSLRFECARPPGTSGDLQLRVERYDGRFGLYIVGFRGAISGKLRAFTRPPPQPQPSTASLLGCVLAIEFTGQRVLVIGGSRGLGELTAKLVAAGGGDVIVSYAQGRSDAERVASDIASVGRGRGEVIAIDFNKVEFAVLPLAGPITSVFYFATPRIFSKKLGVFDAAKFAEFSRFYLERFVQLCEWLERRTEDGQVTVYLPSTVFINERPKGMTEYAMAKVAAEVLADDINRHLRRVRVVHTRLPRLATDQTSSILGSKVESNVETLLPVIRAICSQGASKS